MAWLGGERNDKAGGNKNLVLFWLGIRKVAVVWLFCFSDLLAFSIISDSGLFSFKTH